MPSINKMRNFQLAAYYQKGFTMRETALHFEVSLERVRQILRKYYPNLIRPVGGSDSAARMRKQFRKMNSR